jgi:hypothetical protein
MQPIDTEVQTVIYAEPALARPPLRIGLMVNSCLVDAWIAGGGAEGGGCGAGGGGVEAHDLGLEGEVRRHGREPGPRRASPHSAGTNRNLLATAHREFKTNGYVLYQGDQAATEDMLTSKWPVSSRKC